MQRKLIIPVYPVLQHYGEKSLEEHYRLLLDMCNHKSVGLVFLDSTSDDLKQQTLSAKNLLVDPDAEDEVNDFIDDWCMAHYTAFDYWVQLKGLFPFTDLTVIDLGPTIAEAGNLKAYSLAADTVFERNILESQSDFIAAFGNAKRLLSEIEKLDVDIVITDFNSGFLLHQNRKRDFDFHDDFFVDMFEDHKKNLEADAIVSLNEAKILKSISVNCSPDVDVFLDDGTLSLYFTSEITPGDIQIDGIGSDEKGLSRFSGNLKHGRYLNFKLTYFLDAIFRDCLNNNPILTEEPINFAFDLVLGKAQYWKGSNTEHTRTPFNFASRRKMVFK